MHQIHTCIINIMGTEWKTIYEVRDALCSSTEGNGKYYSDGAVSRRMRELRRFGYDLEKRHLEGRNWEYRLMKFKAGQQPLFVESYL